MHATAPHLSRPAPTLVQRLRAGRWLAALWLGGALASAHANPDTAALETTAREWLKPALEAQLPVDANLPLRTEVEMGSLDSRLRLAPCDKVEPHLPPGARLWGRSRIGLRCVEGPRRWNVYIPVTVKAWGPAWVLKRPVDAGATLTADDAEQVEVDWAAQSSSVMARPDMWVGQLAAFPLTPGQTIRENMLRPVRAFDAGDEVRIQSKGTGFNISATGKALSAGLVGQSARIRLPGGRVVSGEVQSDQTVELGL